MNVGAAAQKYLKKHGRPVTIDGAPAYVEWGKPVDAKIGSVRVPGVKGLCNLPAQPGARIDDGPDIYAVTQRTVAPDGATVDAVLMAARATVYRTTPVKDAVSKITRHTEAQAATGIPCLLHVRHASLTEGDEHWQEGVAYIMVLLTRVIQAGDEIVVAGAPRLKAGEPYRPDGQPLWLVPGTAVSTTHRPGLEV